MAYWYKNRSSITQTINLNSGRTLYVQSKEEVKLESGEESSDEILGKIRGAHPTGSLRNDAVAAPIPTKGLPPNPKSSFTEGK